MTDQVARILAEKARDEVLSIDAEAPVLEAVRQMVDANVGSLLVTERGRINGIVTERDYLRAVALDGRVEEDTPVRELASSPLLVVEPSTPVEECMALMTDRRIRYLPVAEDDEVVGLISIGDVVKFESRQRSFQIQYLTDYIAAR